MNVFLRIDINLIAMILLAVVLFIARRRLDKQDALNKTYLTLARIIGFEILFETLTCIINTRPELWLIPVSVFLHISLFVTGPILTFFWLIFIRNIVTKSSPLNSKRNIPLLIPVAVNAVITLLSPVYNLVFFISDTNVYQRGPLFIVSAAIIYMYLLLGMAFIIKNRRMLVRQDFVTLCFSGILPLIGGLAQTFFYGALLMWSCTAFSMIIVYIFLAERMVHLDYLTGTWNRHSFEHYISQRVKQKSGDKLGIIYIDIDGLKNINDVYGHAEGDTALKTAINIIKGAIRKGDVISRLGGDEFAIILNFEDGNRELLENTIKRIEEALADYNQTSGKTYTLQCSFGADVFCPENCSLEQFMHGIDVMMYDSKKQKKSDYDISGNV